MIQLLDMVALAQDIPEQKALRGQVGTIIEYLAPDVYLVEFSNNEGVAYAMLTLPADLLILLRDTAAPQA